MIHIDHKDLEVGTPVHVEFDGEIYPDYSNYKASPNHIVVSDGNFVHHVHRHSPNVTQTGPARPTLEEGQLWRAGAQNFIYLNGEFESPTEAYARTDEFFRDYPDAALLVRADGTVVAGSVVLTVTDN